MLNVTIEERECLIKAYASQLAPSSKVNRWLGPPDLVVSSGSERCVHVLGVDVESVASVAAFINTLLLSFPNSITSASTSININGSSNSRKLNERVTQVIYCCYNAERALDMRIQASIPGGITCTAYNTSHSIDDEMTLGEDEALWRETRTSAVLRAILYHHDNHSCNATSIHAQDSVRRVCGDYEQVLLECIRYKSSWTISPHWNSEDAAKIDNYLTDAILATNLRASKIMTTCLGDNRLLVARMMHKEDCISDAIQLLCDAIIEEQQLGDNPEILAVYLHHQLRLLSNGSANDTIDLVSLAKETVRRAPLEPAIWIGLACVYVDRKHYDLALLALNSCPSHALASYQYTRDKCNLENDMYDLRDVHVKAIYGMLARINEELGWQSFMQLRDELFITYKPQEDALLHVKSGINASNEASTLEQNHAECSLQTKGQQNCKQEEARSKRICEPAIDELVFALHADLCAFRSYLASHGQACHSLLDKWQMARLCLRLHKGEVAKQILHTLTNSKADKFELVGASLELLTELYAGGGQIGHALVAISRTLSIGAHLLLSTPSSTNNDIPFGMKAAISGMAARFGTLALRDAMHVLAAEIGQKALKAIEKVIDIECVHIDY